MIDKIGRWKEENVGKGDIGLSNLLEAKLEGINKQKRNRK
jgi:hypothetical protein